MNPKNFNFDFSTKSKHKIPFVMCYMKALTKKEKSIIGDQLRK